MSTLNLRLPESLHEQVRSLAKVDGVSINQFITLAISEKVTTLLTLDYIRERARRASRADFEDVLAQIGAAERDPVAGDELPDDLLWLRETKVEQIMAEMIDSRS